VLDDHQPQVGGHGDGGPAPLERIGVKLGRQGLEPGPKRRQDLRVAQHLVQAGQILGQGPHALGQ
jgi:hypothetical protein